MASDSGSTAMSADESQPPVRRSARHAAPRRTVRGRMQLPVGRALALTAVPTALLMGSIAPKLAFAADTRTAAPISTGSSGPAATGTDCTKEAAAAKSAAASTAPQQGSSAKSSATQSSTSKAAPRTGTPVKAATAPTATAVPVQRAQSAPQQAAPATAPTTAPSAAPTTAPASAPVQSPDPANPIDGLLHGIGTLLGLNQHAGAGTGVATPTATATPTAAARTAPRAAAVPAAAATTAPAASHTTAPAAPVGAPVTAPTTAPGTPSAPSTGTPTKAPTTPAATATPGAATHVMCDASHLAAPMDTSVIGAGEFPKDPWTLKSSDLELINTQFWGVKTIPTAGGDVRVLKFTAQEVNIGDLDMSTQQNGQRLHVQGGAGTTSTMRDSTVTMYVTSLSGTLKAAEGIPLGWLNLSLTLTPDTLPDWLYNLVGSIPVPLTLEFSDATAIQAGQVGGTLTIPGMHLFYTAS
ncbi:hypothetical protein [Streptacidiphilus sp. EB129]|uniref:hypothetical protein n=1 Tax=Streptacidiphilus sp. EB129 TaxID=3156262 RepID=UPI0035114682